MPIDHRLITWFIRDHVSVKSFVFPQIVWCVFLVLNFCWHTFLFFSLSASDDETERVFSFDQPSVFGMRRQFKTRPISFCYPIYSVIHWTQVLPTIQFWIFFFCPWCIVRVYHPVMVVFTKSFFSSEFDCCPYTVSVLNTLLAFNRFTKRSNYCIHLIKIL